MGGCALLAAVGLNHGTLAAAQRFERVASPPGLWATVNVCDTPAYPNTIGIRGSMPGAEDRRQSMWMRFEVQYYDEAAGRWFAVAEGGDSGFVPVGLARRSRQAGRSFRIEPKAGDSVLLRGKVTFQWRRKGEILRQARRRTTKGHESRAGADPAGYTAASCEITRP